jgi:hypothetical protein
MGALMSGDNDPQNDLPLFQPSEVTDPEERIKVIDVELKKLGEEKRSALDDDALLMNIIRQIKRLTEEKSVSLSLLARTDCNQRRGRLSITITNILLLSSPPLPLLHIGTHQKAEHHLPLPHRRMLKHPQGCG